MSGSAPPPQPPIRPLGTYRSDAAKNESTSSGAIGNQAVASSSTSKPLPKMAFKPKLVARTKPAEVKQEPASSTERGRGTGRGRGERGRGGDRGRGRGRGAAPRAPIELTASGPFAMPVEGSGSARRAPVRIQVSNSSLPGMGSSSSMSGLVKTERSTSSRLGAVGEGFKEEETEEYSGGEDGEVVDMSNVKSMDWNAPEALKKVQPPKSKKQIKKEEAIIKLEQQEVDSENLSVPPEDMKPKVNLANALDLSEDEEEEELVSLTEDFVIRQGSNDTAGPDLSRDGKLLFFQFPSPFPNFIPPPSQSGNKMEVDEPVINDTGSVGPDGSNPPETPESSSRDKGKGKAITPGSGIADVKPSVPAKEEIKKESKTTSASTKSSKNVTFAPPPPTEPLNGVIGQLEFYKSGAVKMRIGEKILLDLSAATQPSFLQHAVYLDTSPDNTPSLTVLGEVNRRYVVSPNMDSLLDDMERLDKTRGPSNLGGLNTPGLVKMEL